MSDVFVSYKAEDRRRVQPIVEALEADGLSVWWDRQIGGGDSWREAIEQHLDAARCVLVVWSKRSVGPDGHFVRDEASRALRRHIYLPVRIDRVNPPLGFGETQSLSLIGWKGDGADPRIQSVVEAARAIAAGDPYVAPEYSHGDGISRRTIAIGGAVTVAAAAAGGWLAFRSGSTAASDSIAVLPFANLSGDPAQSYFSDGIAEELRSALSRIAGLKVVARASSEAVRDADIKTAAQRLDVTNILTGSVRRSPSMVRVSAQLVDGGKGIERWSEIYDRSAGDALQIQTDIANKVAEALSIRLGSADRKRISEGGTNSAEAHDLLLKAQAYAQQNEGSQAWERAIGMVDAALALDPNYADAIAVKAGMLKVRAGAYASTAEESRRLYREAEAVAKQAIRLAPQVRIGYSILGDILYEQLYPRLALVQYEKMLALPGGDAAALRGYAVFLGENKRTDEALGVIDRALAVDPLNAQIHGWKAYILAAGRRYEEAIDVTRHVIRLVPHRKQTRIRLGYYLTLAGKYPEAAEAMNVPGPYTGVHLVYRAVLALRMGKRAEAEAALTQLRQSDFAYFQLAELLAQLGRKDEAIETLNKAWGSRDSGLTMILIDPLLDPLRGDPQFEAIVKRIDFPL